MPASAEGGAPGHQHVALDALRATLAQWQQRQLATLKPKTRDLWETADYVADAARCDHLPREVLALKLGISNMLRVRHPRLVFSVGGEQAELSLAIADTRATFEAKGWGA